MKTQLKISVNFICSKYSDDTRTMYIRSVSIEIMICNDTV